MSFLIGVFVAMAIYGFVIGKNGAALISIFMAAFAYWGNKVLERKEAEYEQSARHAQCMKDNTMEILEGCECSGCTSGPRLPNEKSRSDLDI